MVKREDGLRGSLEVEVISLANAMKAQRDSFGNRKFGLWQWLKAKDSASHTQYRK